MFEKNNLAMKRCLVFLLLTFLVPGGYCQNILETKPEKGDDSFQKGNQLHRLSEQSDSVRLSNSIQKIILTRQIERLQTNEISRKKELETQLRNLEATDSLSRSRLFAEMDSLRRVTKGYPVIPFKDTLFLIYSRVGSVPASVRAAYISSQLRTVAKDYSINPDSIMVATDGGFKDIIYKEKILLAVTHEDALWNNISQDSLAKQYCGTIVSVIKKYRESVSFKTILTAVIFSLVVLVSFIFIIRLIRYLFRKLDNNLIPKIHLPEKWQIIKDFDTIHQERRTKILLILSKFLRFVIYFFLTIITILLIFNIVPQTKPIGETLLRYILDPLRNIGIALVKYVPNLITIIIIIFLFRLVIRLFRYFSREISSGGLNIPGFYPEWSKPTFVIVRFFLIILMIVFIFPFLPGSNSDAFKGISVFIGLVISISSTSIIGNLLAGLVITFMRSFKIGDSIKIGENTGIVIEKSAFVTRIRTYKGEFINIPHSNILASHIVNYSASAADDKLILYTTITIGYDVPWQKVHAMMINAALVTGYILKEPAPFVLQTSLNDYHISYQLNAYTRNPEIQPQIYSELHQNIQNKFNEAGVEILSPMYNAVRDGNITS
jgi:small-conductance mechanosensitive channel